MSLDNEQPSIEGKPKDRDKEKGKAKSGKEAPHPPIIRKIKKHAHGHHGGAWKIAYADFVTAMMAFFLLMWLLASLNKAQKDGISEYFRQPLKVALISGDSMGAREVTVKGGGDNIEKEDGQVSASTQPVTKNQPSPEEAGSKKKEEENEAAKLKELQKNITLTIEEDPSLHGLKDQLVMDDVDEGLRIQLVDQRNQPMFGVGSDKMDPEMEKILEKIAVLLNKMPNMITIQGHTDAHPYHNPEELEQTNWELSTQRANAARRALVTKGVPEEKILEVSGFASTVLLNKDNPLDPKNRRISIIVMKKAAQTRVLNNK